MSGTSSPLVSKYPQFFDEIVSICDSLDVCVHLIGCDLVIESESRQYPLHLSKTNAAESQQVLSRWSGFDARLSPEALSDPSSEEAQTVLAQVRCSLTTALAGMVFCGTCQRVTPQIRISRRRLPKDEYLDFYRCLECGYEGSFVDYPNKN